MAAVRAGRCIAPIAAHTSRGSHCVLSKHAAVQSSVARGAAQACRKGPIGITTRRFTAQAQPEASAAAGAGPAGGAGVAAAQPPAGAASDSGWSTKLWIGGTVLAVVAVPVLFVTVVATDEDIRQDLEEDHPEVLNFIEKYYPVRPVISEEDQPIRWPESGEVQVLGVTADGRLYPVTVPATASVAEVEAAIRSSDAPDMLTGRQLLAEDEHVQEVVALEDDGTVPRRLRDPTLSEIEQDIADLESRYQWALSNKKTFWYFTEGRTLFRQYAAQVTSQKAQLLALRDTLYPGQQPAPATNKQ